MTIKEELQKLHEPDIWSLLLFVLFKIKDIPEYSGISELAYILDRKNLLKLCEYFGGTTITIPTIEELEILVYGLLLYQYINIEGIPEDDALVMISREGLSQKAVKNAYLKIKETLQNYDLSVRSRNDL